MILRHRLPPGPSRLLSPVPKLPGPPQGEHWRQLGGWIGLLALIAFLAMMASCAGRQPLPPPGRPTVLEELWRIARPHLEALAYDLARYFLGYDGAPRATPTPVPTVAATPTATPTHPPAPPEVRQLTGGSARVRIHFDRFQPGPDGLDVYAAATLAWSEPGADLRPDTPALELQLRGTAGGPCLASPCGPSALGLVARFSANVAHDGAEPDERRHCGEGIHFAHRLPIGPGPSVEVLVEWGPGLLRVSTPHGSWTARRGTEGPGFGRFWAPLPRDRGLGWSRYPWVLPKHGGWAELVSWEAVGGQRPLVPCP